MAVDGVVVVVGWTSGAGESGFVGAATAVVGAAAAVVGAAEVGMLVEASTVGASGTPPGDCAGVID
jgi:hypothetical protein